MFRQSCISDESDLGSNIPWLVLGYLPSFEDVDRYFNFEHLFLGACRGVPNSDCRSSNADASVWPSGEKETAPTQSIWPSRCSPNWDVASHNRLSLSCRWLNQLSRRWPNPYRYGTKVQKMVKKNTHAFEPENSYTCGTLNAADDTN
jgi:hypothetical protein